MPSILREDANSITYLTDDGQEVTTAKTPTFAAAFGPAGNKVKDFITGGSSSTVPATSSAPVINKPLTISQEESDQLKANIAKDKNVFANSSEVSQEGAASSKPNMSSGAVPQFPLTIPMTTTQTTSTSVSPEVYRLSDEATQLGVNAAQNIGAAHSQIGLERQKASQDSAAVRQQMVEETQRAADAAKSQFGEYQRNFDTLYKEYSDAKIQPKSLFTDGDLGQNIGAAIAIALGAVGAGLQGSNRNVALDIMNQAIDRDLDAQKVNLEKKREELNVLGVKYQAARQAGFDDLNARRLAKADALDTIAENLAARTAPLEGTIAANNAKITEASFKQAAAELRAKTSESKTTTIKEDKAVDLSKVPGMSPPNLSEGDKNKLDTYINKDTALTNIREALASMQEAGKNPNLVRSVANNIAAKLGLQDVDEALLENAIRTQNMQLMLEIAGTSAAEPLRAALEEIGPRMKDNPKVFMARLNSLEDTNARGYANFILRNNLEGNRFTPRLRSQFYNKALEEERGRYGGDTAVPQTFNKVGD